MLNELIYMALLLLVALLELSLLTLFLGEKEEEVVIMKEVMRLNQLQTN